MSEPRSETKLLSLTLTAHTIDAALACLAALAADDREPERYRGWYSAAHEEVAAAYKVAAQSGSSEHP